MGVRFSYHFLGFRRILFAYASAPIIIEAPPTKVKTLTNIVATEECMSGKLSKPSI